MIVPEDRWKDEEDPEERKDLITIHIYKDQIVKLTEDVIRWMFHKVKSAFKKKKTAKRKDDAGHSK